MEMTVLGGMRVDQHPADGVTHALLDLAIVLLANALLAIVLPRMVVTRPMIMMMLGGRRCGLRNRQPSATARFLGCRVRLPCCGRHRIFLQNGLYPIPRRGK